MGSLEKPVDAILGWEISELPEKTGTVVINIYPDRTSETEVKSLLEDSFTCEALQYLLENIRDGNGLIKLLLSVQSGYVVQSDFVTRRMVDCPDVSKVQGFVTPGQHIIGCTADKYQTKSLSDLLSSCYGVIIIQRDVSPSTAVRSESLDAELVNRLSFPWLSPNPIFRKRLAVVGAGSLIKIHGYVTAAASLNIGLVVFDEASHWMSGDSYRQFREKFEALDMTVNEGLAERLIAKLVQYQQKSRDGERLDGIISVDEHLLTIIAHVATQLGFNTSPPESVGLAQNKFKTRQLDTSIFCWLVSSQADLERKLSDGGTRVPYPLIVKPAKGWSSEGVWKVDNEKELREKVALLWRDSFTAWHGRDVVIETYIDGPEVDANMVLDDGRIVFFEANDDFPSAGDYDGKENLARVPNFVETSNMIPSALPSSEIQSLRQRLHELALAAGFRNGVLHMEAKMRNSSCYYAEDPGADGLVDLQLRKRINTTTQSKDVFLLEINPRAPGWQEVEATARTYGVSYYSLCLLSALAEKERIVSLSKPFEDGPQYHMQILFVAALKGGIYNFGDICTSVLKPNLRATVQEEQLDVHVVKCANLMEDGEEVLDPSTGQVYGNFIASFLVISRKSRKEAMRIGHEIERRVRERTGGF